MPRTFHEVVNAPEARIGPSPHVTLSLPFSPATAASIGDRGDHPYPLQSAPNQASQDLIDGSGPIFSMYLEMASEEDKKMAKNWKADADGILIFVRLYLLIPCFALTRRS